MPWSGVLRTGLALAAVLSALAAPLQPAAAQRPPAALLVSSVSDLSFGAIVGSMPRAVQPSDAARRGEFVIRGSGEIEMSFHLPSHLVSPYGARLPLSFGATDGLVWTDTSKQTAPFDPRLPLRLRLSGNSGEARLYLGGTVAPLAHPAAGDYTASITIVVMSTKS